MTEFFSSPLFYGGILIAIACFTLECANCLGRIRDDVSILRRIEQRRAQEESRYYMEALDREIAAHDARTTTEASGASEPQRP
jgi:hypothetical protein